MSRMFIRAALAMSALVVAGAGCGTNTTTPVTPTPTTITEPPFVGVLNVNGAVTQTFTTAGSGSVTVTLASLDPDPDGTTEVGMQLGTWNGTTCAVVVPTLSSDHVTVGVAINGSVTQAAVLCARVYDPGGKLTGPEAFTVNIVHN